MKYTYIFFLFLLLSLSSKAQYINDCYEVLDSNIANPDRGFTMYYVYGGADFKTLLKDYPTGSSEKMITTLKHNKYSLVAMVNILRDYKTQPISQGYLDTLEQNFQTLRDSGLKCVLLFYYDIIDGPSYEPELTKLLADIDTLKPIIRRYQDVVYVMKHGFIGPWGEEWSSTDYQFGTLVRDNLGNPMITQAHYEDRKIVFDSILSIFTDNKIVSVRTPIMRFNLFGKCYADTITEATAHSSGPWYRVGQHNDAFLASSNDLGTWDWGIPMYNNCVPWVAGVSNTISDGALFYEVIKTESRYTVNGGETGAPETPSFLPECAGSIDRMKSNHLSYLSSSWYGPFLDNWSLSGCYDDIEMGLGYRFVLDSSRYHLKMQKENVYNIKLFLSNLGYASTTYKKNVSLVFKHLEYNNLYTVPLPDVDTRKWYPGENIIIDHDIQSVHLYGGTYDIFLQIQDQSDTLKNNKDYNVRLATSGIWDSDLKMNKINRAPCTLYWYETPGYIPNDTLNYCDSFYARATNSSNVSNDEITSVDKAVGRYLVSISPNPAKGEITLRLGQAYTEGKDGVAFIKSIKICDISGRVLIHENLNNLTKKIIDISTLNAGLYYIEISDGRNKVVEKLVVSK